MDYVDEANKCGRMEMTADNWLTMDNDGRAALVNGFEAWTRAHGIDAPNGQHVVRFCADMWVAHAAGADLGIPTVWSVLRAAGAFSP